MSSIFVYQQEKIKVYFNCNNIGEPFFFKFKTIIF